MRKDPKQRDPQARPPLDAASLDAARAWVDGDLDLAASAGFEREMRDAPTMREAVARVRALQRLLSELPRVEAPARIRADLRDRVREAHDPVVGAVRSLPRAVPSPSLRESVRLRFRETIAASATAPGTTSPDRASVDALPARSGWGRLAPGALRFAAAAVLLLAASAALLSGGRRQPQRPAGALALRVEFAHADVRVVPAPAVEVPAEGPR